MTTRMIEVFSAGCSVCDETISLIHDLACSSCKVVVLDMQNIVVADRARNLRIRSLPAVVIDGSLSDCCVGREVDEAVLMDAGLGVPIP